MVVGEAAYQITDPTIDFPDGDVEGNGRDRILQCFDAEIRRAGYSESRRVGLETRAYSQRGHQLSRRGTAARRS